MQSRLAIIAGMFGGLCQNQSVFADTVRHYEYVFIAGSISVYDTDNNFTLVKTIPVPTSSGPRGSVASAVTGMLYISYGPDGWAATGDGGLIKYDLTNDQVVWNRTYSFGIDSMSISPDGSTIYMPTGENAAGGIWEVIDAGTGNVTGAIDSRGIGPHNTVLNESGTHVYMAPRGSNYLVEADTSTRQILQKIGPVTTAPGTVGVRPFTINGSETLALMTATGLLGFQVGDIATGKILYTVPINGFSWDGSGGDTAPSHGISLSPDEKELYVVDSANSYVHVYDITGLPGSAPWQVADLPLTGRMSGVEAGCAYDCYRSGWVHHSRDGRYVFVGDSGDVIDTTTRRTVGTLSALANSRISIEVDFQDGVPVWAMQNRSSIGTAAATAPPTPSSAIPLVQTSAAQGRAVNSLASSFTTANTAGNLIIAFVRMSTTTQTVRVTDTAGNTYTDAVSQVQTIDGHQVHIFYAKDIAGGSNTVTARFSSVNNYPWLAIYEYSGLSPVNPLDRTSSAQGFSSLPATGTMQTAKAPELVFVGTGFPANFEGSATSVPPFSLNQVNTSTSPAANESAIATTAGTAIKGAVNLSTGTDWTAIGATFAAPEPSGISLAQSNAVAGSFVPSVSAAFQTGNQAGNLIVAFVRMSTTTQTVQISDSAGNLYHRAISQAQTADEHQIYIYYAQNIVGGANTVKAQFSSTNNHPWLAIYEYNGLSQTNPLDITAAAQGSSAVASAGPTALTRAANELVFVGAGFPTNYTLSATVSSPYALAQINSSGSPGANATAVFSRIGSVTGDLSLSSSTDWTAVVATFSGSN